MRPLLAIALAAGLLLAPSEALPDLVSVEGTVTRISSQSCRVEFHLTWTPTGPPDPPPTTCNEQINDYLDQEVFGVTGVFGLPVGIEPTATAATEGSILWVLPVGDDFVFTFEPEDAQTNLDIDYGASLTYEYEAYICDPPMICPGTCLSWVFLGRNLFHDEYGEGKIHAELPEAVGESTTFREIPVAVTKHTWGQVKRFFRE